MLTDWNPYDLRGPLGTQDPIHIGFSGGRSSAYMLFHILQAFGGTLPERVHVAFCNTGREFDETLDFVSEVGRRWGVPITWLERSFDNDLGFEIVGHNSAARNGEPFDAVIARRGFLPNGVTRFCTTELKVRAATKWMQSLGYEHWASLVGYRADEKHRLDRTKKREEAGKEPFYTLAPMVDALVTKRMVVDFWKAQPFDLKLKSVRGKTPDGNCDGCFLKSQAYLGGLQRRHPERMGWWTGWEGRDLVTKGDTATFRPPVKMTHSQIAEFIRRQGDMLTLSDQDEGGDCFCTD